MSNKAQKRDLVLYLLGLYLVLKPFYFWRSAIPQVSDFIIIAMVVVYLFKNRFRVDFHRKSMKVLILSFTFFIYILTVNSLWNIILFNRIDVIRISFYYIYNCLVLLFIIILGRAYADLNAFVYRSIAFSVFLQVFFFFYLGGFSGSRAIAFFNNPNQLGYHGLLCCSLLIILFNNKINNSLTFVVSLLLSSLLIFVSLSKAAIISLFFELIGLLFLVRLRTKLKYRILIIYFIIVFLIIFSFFLDELLYNNLLFNSVFQRLSSIGVDEDDSLAGRGYNRLLEYSDYLFFGIGEGAYFRFTPPGEFHSTIGNILLSYGFIGLLLFMILIWSLFQHGKAIEIICLISIFAYGLTHNGIRNTFFWILLALVYVNNNPYSANVRKMKI